MSWTLSRKQETNAIGPSTHSPTCFEVSEGISLGSAPSLIVQATDCTKPPNSAFSPTARTAAIQLEYLESLGSLKQEGARGPFS